MNVPKKILVVVDDPTSRAYVKEVLSDIGFVCVAVESGRDALAQIDVDRDIAVVVSELVMPGLDGVRLGAVDYLIKPVAPAPEAAASVAAHPAHVATSSNAEAMARSALDYPAALRRMRRESGLLSDLDEPSWTILLEVYRADITGRRLSVSKLCALDEASQPTAWRRIRSMEESGLLLREQDPFDARRSFVTLTEPTSRAMADFIARADGLVSGRQG